MSRLTEVDVGNSIVTDVVIVDETEGSVWSDGLDKLICSLHVALLLK
jgi:hypothetical protein